MEQDIINLDSRISDLERWSDRVRKVRISQAPRTLSDGNSGGTLTGANNGLSLSGTIAQLGGLLIKDTTIDGNLGSYSVTYTQLDNFNVSATNTVDLDSDFALIGGSNEVGLTTSATGAMKFKTANLFNAVANIGDIPVLANAGTGEWDWAAPSSNISPYEVKIQAASLNLIPMGSAIGTSVVTPYNNESVPNTRFTNVAGSITCNTAGTYVIEYDHTAFIAGNGPATTFQYSITKNGSTIDLKNVGTASNSQMLQVTGRVVATLVASDVLRVSTTVLNNNSKALVALGSRNKLSIILA